jgi:hypothetical protein
MNNPENLNNNQEDFEKENEDYIAETFKCPLCQNGGAPCPIHVTLDKNVDVFKNFKLIQDKIDNNDFMQEDIETKIKNAPEITDEDIESSNRIADRAVEEERKKQAWDEYLKSPITEEDIQKMNQDLFGKDLE